MLDQNDFLISTDKNKLDIELIYNFLSNSYWANGRSLETIKKSIDNSLCFGLYNNNKQIGFARVISDLSTFGYLADVFIIPEYRGKGLSKMLLEYIFKYPDLQNMRRWLLATKDAHELYKKFGFKELSDSKKFMHILNEDINQ